MKEMEAEDNLHNKSSIKCVHFRPGLIDADASELGTFEPDSMDSLSNSSAISVSHVSRKAAGYE